MKTVLLSCFLVFILAVGLLFSNREGFDSLSDKRAWISVIPKWQTAYALNKKNATSLQTQYSALLTADTALNRIDNLIKPPYNLTDAQISSIYQSETASMNKDLSFWLSPPPPQPPSTIPSVASATPAIPSPVLFGSASGLATPPANPVYQAPAANTITRSVEEKVDSSESESKSPSDWHRCPDMSKYIKKDEIPCWNCTL